MGLFGGRRRRRDTNDDQSRPWLDSWWAGMDPTDDSWRDPPGKPLSKRERDDARRWAAQQRPRGGIVRRLLG